MLSFTDEDLTAVRIVNMKLLNYTQLSHTTFVFVDYMFLIILGLRLFKSSLYIKRGCTSVHPLPFDSKKCYFWLWLWLFHPPPISIVLYLPCKNRKFPKGENDLT